MRESIFFKKDNKIYQATQGARIKNISDNTQENVSINELFSRTETTYGIVLFTISDKWPNKSFDVEVIEEF